MASISASRRRCSTGISSGIQTVGAPRLHFVFFSGLNHHALPLGVFFLFGAGRLSLVRSQPRRAIMYYTQAMRSQIQYRNLHHVSYWEIAIASLALWELGPDEKKAETKTEVEEGKAGENGVGVNGGVNGGVEEHRTDTDGETGWQGGSLGAWRELEREATVSFFFSACFHSTRPSPCFSPSSHFTFALCLLSSSRFADFFSLLVVKEHLLIRYGCVSARNCRWG